MSTTLKAVIVEDEVNGIKNLKNLLTRYRPDVEVIATADSVATGIEMFNNPDIKPDLAFLDINLGDGLVFQMLNKITSPKNFDVIFVTAYEKFAIRAFQYSAIGYIIKPIDPDELVDAIARILPIIITQIPLRKLVFQLLIIFIFEASEILFAAKPRIIIPTYI